MPDAPAGRRLAGRLGPGDARVHPVADFRAGLWRRLTMDAVAGLMVAHRPAERACTDALDIRTLAWRCQGMSCARAAEVSRWYDSTAEQVVDELAGAPGDLGSSILFDRGAGRPLEWGSRNGVLCRIGARHGVPTPISDVLVPLLASASDDPR